MMTFAHIYVFSRGCQSDDHTHLSAQWIFQKNRETKVQMEDGFEGLH